jgi:hypothetical protein
MTVLIRVSCAECGEDFEIGEEFAGRAEFCPACGALNDIPSLNDVEPAEENAFSPPEEPDVHPARSPARGVPSPLWWTLVLGGIAAFIVACFVLFSDNWESRHLDALNDADNRGDVLMVDADYARAAAQYRFVLDTVGGRQIESIYIRQLVERARRGEAQAIALAQSGPHPAAAAPPATQPEVYDALRCFQRDSEAFPLFVRNHPMLFQDRRGNWRRRQFVVWDVSYQAQPGDNPRRISLQYLCASSVTEPHNSARDAANDGQFVDDESPKTVRCQTLFELRGDRWVIIRHDVEAGLPMDALYALERAAFSEPGQ